MNIPKLLTVKEFADVFRVSNATVSNWIANSTIPSEYIVRPSGSRQGSKILINEQVVETLIAPVQDEHTKKHYNCHDDNNAYSRLMSRF